MAKSPLLILFIILTVLAFEGLLFGAEIAERTFPQFNQPQGGGFWSNLDSIVALVEAVWGAVLFFLNLISFNVPGAPFWIRLPIGGLLGGGLVWSIANLIKR